ncbi:unnamed protein product [Amaranthus hypochondriacus]
MASSSSSKQKKVKFVDPPQPPPLVPVEQTKGINGLDKVILRVPSGFTVEVYFMGGQVTSWKNEAGQELLFLSKKAIFKPPKAIRGGIPIIFPQFRNLGTATPHGFARNRAFMLDPDPTLPPTSSKADLHLLLTPHEDDMKYWPFRFEIRLRVSLGLNGKLTMKVRIRNIDTKPFKFTFAFHNYFNVSDVGEVRVEGLETQYYLNDTMKKERLTDQGDSIVFDEEVDKIFIETPDKICILDHESKRTFVIIKEGLPDVAVLNPWEKRAKAIPDLDKKEYRKFVCVVPARIENSITLKPNMEWTGMQELRAVSSTCYSGLLDPHSPVRNDD